MARIVVIGGSGHVGTYLVPRLFDLGHDVVNVSRGQARPYRPHPAWDRITQVQLDRRAEDAAGRFGDRIAALQPDIVIDMISFDRATTQAIATALQGRVEHYIFCSTIWVYGRLATIPSTEDEPVSPIDAYGIGKAESEAWLLAEARRSGFPATCFRPGHIVGEGWIPTSPLGNSDPRVYAAIARGERIVLPNLGLETLHHVHADDLTRWIIAFIGNRAASVGEVFNTVSPGAVTLRAYAEALYDWFGHPPQIGLAPYDEWLAAIDPEFRDACRGHVIRSSCHAIGKSRDRLGFQPHYSSLDAIRQSLAALVAAGTIPARAA